MLFGNNTNRNEGFMTYRIVRSIALFMALIVLFTSAASPWNIPLAPIAPAQASDVQIEEVGSIGGTISDIAVEGTYAYIGEGDNLVVLDVSDPTSPSAVARLPLPDLVKRLVLQSGKAYIASDAGLLIVDVSTPTNPVLVGEYTDMSYVRDVQAVGSLVYIIGEYYDSTADEYKRVLRILDVSDPTNLLIKGDLILHDYVEALDVVDNKAYIAYWDNDANTGGVQVIDVDNPDTPVLKGKLNVEGYNRPTDVQVVGNLAYVDNRYVHIIDVSNADNPISKGSAKLSCGAPWEFQVVDTTVYAADGGYGLTAVDVSNPVAPTDKSFYNDGWVGFTNSVQVVGNMIYATSQGRIQILDISNPDGPVLKGRYDATVGYASSIEVVGNLAYIGNAAGVQVVDTSNPSMPVLKSTFISNQEVSGNPFTQSKSDIQLENKIAYISSKKLGLLMVDMSNPANPSLKGLYYAPYASGVKNVHVAGGIAYIAGSDAVQMIDVSTPTKPTLQSYAKTGDGVSDVQIVGTTMYVADYEGLKILDVSDETCPFQVSSIALPGAESVQIVGTLAYVMYDEWGGDSGLQIFDISDPANPTPKWTYDSNYPKNVQIVDNLLYIFNSRTIEIYDNSDPTSPTLQDTLSADLYSAEDVYVANDIIYVASGHTGLRLLRMKEPTSKINFVQSIGGGVEAVDVQNAIAYTGIGHRLVLLDVSNTAQPTHLSELLLPGMVADVDIVDTHAYIANDSEGLQIVDVSNSAAPTLVGSLDMGGDAEQVHVVGTIAYVAAGYSGLKILDVSNPSAPTQKGSYITSGYAYDVYVVGNYAYVADYDEGLQIVNVQNPAEPVLAGTYDTPGYAYGVSVAGDYAYVADGREGLQIVNVQSPSAPVLAGTYNIADYTYADNVQIVGTQAFIATSNGIEVVDIQTPSAPTQLGNYKVSDGSATDIQIVDNIAYIVAGSGGLQIVDMSTMDNLTNTGSYEVLGSISDVQVTGQYAVTVGSVLQMININNPSAPTVAGSYNAYASNIQLVGKYAFTVSSSYLRIFDISTPTNITQVGSYSTPGYAYDMYVVGNYAYIADSGEGLQIVNISNPAEPTSAGSYATTSNAYGVYVAGSYAYVATRDAGIEIIDISNTASPTLAASFATESYAYDVYVAGNYAYIACSDGLEIVDISNATAPNRVGSYDTTYASDVLVIEHYAFVADSGNGVLVLDISDPTKPTLVARYNTPDSAESVQVVNNDLYVADSGGGLQILHIEGEDMVLPTPTPTPTPSAADSTATPTTVAGEGTPTPTTIAGEGTPTPTLEPGEGTPTPTSVAGEGTPTPTLEPGEGTATPTTVAGEGTPTPTSEAGADIPTPTNTPVPQTIQAEINVEQGGSINVTNNRGLSCNVQVPPNGVADAITLHYQEASAPSTKPGTKFAHGGHAFKLTAYRNGEEQADYTFAQPATMRFSYDDSGMSLDEEQRLLLYSRSTSSDPWQLAATATQHAYDTDNNYVTVLVSHLSEFALFYEQDATQIKTVYLPLITRNNVSQTYVTKATLASDVVCLNPPPAPMPDGFTPDADAQAALDRVNYYREMVGLPLIRLHPNIILAAQNHANYLVTNDGNSAAFPDLGHTPGAHGEVEGFPDFTGASSSDRLLHAGYLIEGNYDRMGGGEVISYDGDPVEAVDRWIETVYHRFPFMDATIDEMGYGKADDNDPDTWNKSDVMNFGSTKWRPVVDTSKVIVYPADGQTGLNPGWNSNSEDPDPYRDDDMVGTVITLSPVGIQTFDSLELRPEGGNAVAMHPLEQDSSDYYTAALDPLEANTTYNVKAIGTDNAGNPLTLEWSFTTGE